MESKTIRLSALQDAEAAQVQQIGLDGAMRRRLLELGLIPGTRVERLYAAPSGSPIAFGVRGAVLALRKADAAQIAVQADVWS